MSKSSLYSVISAKQLQNGGDPFLNVLRDLPDAAVLIDADGNIFYANRTANQLLDFSRERSPEFAPVNINDLIGKTVGLLNHQLQNSRIETRLNLAPYLPTVDGDSSQIQQVLFNLITNARQASETIGRREKVIKIITDTAFLPSETFSRPHIVITVSDNSGGIPEESLPNVFNPFFTANKEGGTGLGLAISHRIVQRHLGALTIENNQDKGVKAIVRLPLSQQ